MAVHIIGICAELLYFGDDCVFPFKVTCLFSLDACSLLRLFAFHCCKRILELYFNFIFRSNKVVRFISGFYELSLSFPYILIVKEIKMLLDVCDLLRADILLRVSKGNKLLKENFFGYILFFHGILSNFRSNGVLSVNGFQRFGAIKHVHNIAII